MLKPLPTLTKSDGNDDENQEMTYTGERVVIGAAYEYDDAPSAFIGRGSYGIVYKGLEQNTNKAVAIKKMLRLNVKPDELEAMKCVRNDHLVTLIDVIGESEDITYLVMEYCDTDLDRYLRLESINGCLQASEMEVVIDSIARGYFALFQKHIVHRDIKPQNVLLVLETVDGKNVIQSAKITDFGVSRVLTDEKMGLCNVAGTLFYMAPEVGANLVIISEYNSECDMWSIGVLFYQCLIGSVPFDESTLCRLFLYCAGENFDAYELPQLPPTHCDCDCDFQHLITSLLEIDSTKRLKPNELLAAVELIHIHRNKTAVYSFKTNYR